MSSRFLKLSGAAAIAAMLVLSSPAFAQSDGADMEMRIQRLENQLRQLTGQNEELQHRNRLLEERLRQLGGAPEAAQPQAAQAPVAPPSVAAMPPVQPNPPLRQPQPGYPPPQPGYGQPQIAAPAPIMQEPRRAATAAAMRSTPAGIRTLPVHRARLAAVSSRYQTKQRSVLRADAGPASRSILARHPARRARPGGPARRVDHAAAIGHA